MTVMLCSQSQLISSEIHMLFDLQPNSDRVYIAEVTFFPTAAICKTSDTPFLPGDTTVSHPNADLNMTTPAESSDLPTSTIVLASYLTAVLITTCLLATMFILWRCYYIKDHKHTPSLLTAAVYEEMGGQVARAETSAGGEGHVYEQVGRGKGVIAASDPIYMEVGEGGDEGNTFQLDGNEAYAEGNAFQLEGNDAYASYAP